MTAMLAPVDVQAEIVRAVELIRSQVAEDERAFVLVSGGLDSDVVARLAARAVTSSRLKFATVIQDDMNPAHIDNARALSQDLGTTLVEIDLRGANLDVLYRLAVADPSEGFNPLGLLDPSRMKCSLRTVLLSSYQDRGYVTIGTSNRTESQLGFFLPFGDGIWHLDPIAHLYKTEVRLFAAALGTAERVMMQPPSAGFWADETDREDLGYWLVNRAPIQRERDFTEAEVAQAAEISERLDEGEIDRVLLMLSNGETVSDSSLGDDIIERLRALTKRSARLKTRPTGVCLSRVNKR